MADTAELEEFLQAVLQEVLVRVELDDEEKLREDQFSEVVIERLVEAGELDDGELCYHRSRGVKVNGYHISDDAECLDLFVTNCGLDGSVETLPKAEIDAAFRRVSTFLTKSLDSYHRNLEEASDAFSLSHLIHEAAKDLTRVRMYLFSDRVSRMAELPHEQVGDVEVSYHIWDLERLHRCASSGLQREPIQIDCEELFGEPLQCLPARRVSDRYLCFLSVLSGEALVSLYSRFGPRLLERNVRCFLQARGNVNKGIRATIGDEPEMFLAYNNGLSATAGAVETVKLDDGSIGIRHVSDFQIINGGQTTGSIYHAAQKDKACVDAVAVPMKLTVLPNEATIEELAPLISKYANSQNKVNTADFSSNHPFHVKLEEQSRTVWAPAAAGMQRQTRWFYERSRGQYLDAKGREPTRAKKKAFEEIHPTRQKFTKTDLAKFENSWSQLPHIVSRGAQKNFAEFMLRLDKRGAYQVDESYFHRLVAKAIMFRRTEKIVSAQKFGGYRANIVTYTIALISNKTAQRIDLEQIWKDQGLSRSLEEFIEHLCHSIHRHVTETPGGQNVTEWCKKELCWAGLKETDVSIPNKLQNELISVSKRAANDAGSEVDRGLENVTDDEKAQIDAISKVPAETWFAISKWAKETSNLQGWQRSLSFSLGKVVAQGRSPSRKQAKQGEIILNKAEELGFVRDVS